MVGRYLDPPRNAVVLCVDEKSQIHALDRATASSLTPPATAPRQQASDQQERGGRKLAQPSFRALTRLTQLRPGPARLGVVAMPPGQLHQFVP